MCLLLVNLLVLEWIPSWICQRWVWNYNCEQSLFLWGQFYRSRSQFPDGPNVGSLWQLRAETPVVNRSDLVQWFCLLVGTRGRSVSNYLKSTVKLQLQCYEELIKWLLHLGKLNHWPRGRKEHVSTVSCGRKERMMLTEKVPSRQQ